MVGHGEIDRINRRDGMSEVVIPTSSTFSLTLALRRLYTASGQNRGSPTRKARATSNGKRHGHPRFARRAPMSQLRSSNVYNAFIPPELPWTYHYVAHIHRRRLSEPYFYCSIVGASGRQDSGQNGR